MMTEDEIRDIFREMREEPVPLESLVRVRVRLEGRIRRRTPWKIAAWAAACVVLAIAAFTMQTRPTARQTARQQVAVHRPAAPPVSAPDVVDPVAVRPAIERKLHKPRPQPSVQPVSIRIETPDPDVVILLVSDSRGERNRK